MMGEFFFLISVYAMLLFFVAFILMMLYIKSKESPQYSPYPLPLAPRDLIDEKELIKRRVLLFTKVLYITFIIFGFVVSIAGLLIINFTGNGGVIVFGAVETLLGILIIFLSFRAYKLHLKRLWESVIPKIIGF